MSGCVVVLSEAGVAGAEFGDDEHATGPGANAITVVPSEGGRMLCSGREARACVHSISHLLPLNVTRAPVCVCVLPMRSSPGLAEHRIRRSAAHRIAAHTPTHHKTKRREERRKRQREEEKEEEGYGERCS